MAKLEIPSIVVHSGSPSVPGINMDRPSRQTPQLRKQKSSMDDSDAAASGCIHHSKSEATGPASSSNGNAGNNNNNNNQESPPHSSESGGGGKPSSPGSPNANKTEDGDKPASGPQPQLSRSRSNGKMKMLTRSHAMREATSPPPDPTATANSNTTPSNAQSTPVVNNGNGKNNSQASRNSYNSSSNHHTTSNSSGSGSNNNNNNNNNKAKNGNNKQNNKEQMNKEISSFMSNKNSRQNKNFIIVSSSQEDWTGLLSRDNSTDSQYQDASKADLLVFIAQQMSTKNRPLLLKVEEFLTDLVQDPRPVYFRFPQMSSFHRMLVHRAATYFNMDHNLDSSGTCVIVNKNRNSRLPERTFLQVMRDMKGLGSRAYSSEEPRKSILKRDFASFEDGQYKSDDKQLSLESRRSKSFEEREEEYERARRRIFSREDSTNSCIPHGDSNQNSMEDVRWSECATWSGNEPEPVRRYLRPTDGSSRLMKTESYESRDMRGSSARSAVSKSHSFGGYTVAGGGTNSSGRLGPSHGQSYSALQRGDSNSSSLSTSSRVLAKQDSGSSASSRLSPSSSGYKSQSQQSDATLSTTPSPTTTPHSLLPMSSQGSEDTLSPEPPVIWPMTSLGNIPPGSVLINPATGQPICNADGSVYRYDPDHPLTLHIPRASTPPPPSGKSPSATTPNQDNLKEECEAKVEEKATTTAAAPPPCPPAGTADNADPAKGKEAVTAAKRPGAAGAAGAPQQREREERRRADGSAPRASLTVHTEGAGAGRSLTNSATSPMAVPPPPIPRAGAPPGPVPPSPAPAYSMSNGVMYPVPYGLPQPYAGAGSFGYAPVEGQGQYCSPYHVSYHVDPATGAYVMPPPQQQQQQQQPPPQQHQAVAPACGQPGPCCSLGYPCPYASPAGPPPGPPGPPGPPASYDQRSPDTAGQGVDAMTSYMMGMTLNGPAGPPVGVDQRAGGDAPSMGSRSDGPSPQLGPQQGLPPGPPPAPQHVLVGAPSGSYFWSPQISSHNQGYPSTVMYYYPPSSAASPQGSAGSVGSAATPGPYNRGTSPAHSSHSGVTSASAAMSSSASGAGRSGHGRNVAASYAKGAAIYQPPPYSMQGQDRNGYPGDCLGAPPQQVVYTVSSMHSSTVPTQSYQPALYSSAGAGGPGAAAGPGAMAYYPGLQGGGDAAGQNPAQALMQVSAYAGPQGYLAAATPPLTPQGSYGVHPYMYSMYPQAGNSPAPAGQPAMMPRMMRPTGPSSMGVGGVQSSPPPRGGFPKGFPRGQSPAARKDADSYRFSQPYSMPMYNLAASRYVAGDMRYMSGRLPFSIPSTNSYHRAIRPFQTSYHPRPHSQSSGEALSLARATRVRKPT